MHAFDEIPTDSTPWNSLLPMLKLDVEASLSRVLPGACHRSRTAFGESPSHVTHISSIIVDFYASEHRPTL
jgi:hypothetical protein